MKISISPSVFKKYPETVEYVVVLRDGNNMTSRSREIIEFMEVVQKEIRNTPPDEKNEKRFALWNEIYSEVANASGQDLFHKTESGEYTMKASHIALLERVLSGKDLPNINPIVNYYNSFSLKYGIPAGGEDLKKIYGDFELRETRTDELFLGIAESKITELPAKEIVWADQFGPTCRMWNWRQSERDKVDKYSTDIVFVFDCVKQTEKYVEIETGKSFEAIIDEFVGGLGEYFGGEIINTKLDINNPELNIEYIDTKADLQEILKDKRKYLEQVAYKAQNKGTKGLTKRRTDNLGLNHESSIVTRLDGEFVKVCHEAGFLETESSLMLGRSSMKNSGDFSTPIALKMAGLLKRSPVDIASEIAQALKGHPATESADVANNGFINVSVKDSYLVHNLNELVMNFEDMTQSTAGDRRVMLVESPSPNPNKALHVGHLLNLFIGTSLIRLFEKAGFVAHNDTIINDKGMPIAKTIWAIMNYGAGKSPESEQMKPDHWVDKYYVIGAKAFKDSLEVRREVRAILKKIESRDPDVSAIWKMMIEFVLQGQGLTLNRLGEKWGHLWFESELFEKGKEIILQYVDGDKLIQLPDGGVVGKLEDDYGVPDVVLIKSDGTSLYHTFDTALTLEKIKKYNPWKAIWVVGNEQITHFQRLFSLLDLLKIMPIENLYHYAYGYVFDKNGEKMSSRSGDALTADGLIDDMKARALEIMREMGREEVKKKDEIECNECKECKGCKEDEKEREKDWKDNEISVTNIGNTNYGLLGSKDADEELAEKLAIAALKYSFLSVDPFKDTRFDPEKALSYTGKSGPYILYALVRCRGILNRVGSDALVLRENTGGLADASSIANGAELSQNDRDIILKLMQYQDVIMTAVNNYMPSVVADYLFDLAKDFSAYYENNPVLDAEYEVRELRVGIIRAVAEVLNDGLELLGIESVERM